MARRITCRECGQPYAYLPTHLRSAHGMSSAEYRERHGIAPDVALESDWYRQAHSESLQRPPRRVPRMTMRQFGTIALLLQNRGQSRSREAARLVLVEGQRIADVAREMDLAYPGVREAVVRMRDAYLLICDAGPWPAQEPRSAART